MGCVIEDRALGRIDTLIESCEYKEANTPNTRAEWFKKIKSHQLYVNAYVYEYQEEELPNYDIEYRKRKILSLSFRYDLDVEIKYDWIRDVKCEPIFSEIWECRNARSSSKQYRYKQIKLWKFEEEEKC